MKTWNLKYMDVGLKEDAKAFLVHLSLNPACFSALTCFEKETERESRMTQVFDP